MRCSRASYGPSGAAIAASSRFQIGCTRRGVCRGRSDSTASHSNRRQCPYPPDGPYPVLQRGDTVGPYRILEPLGEGGMGAVFLADDPRLDRRVAIKVLPEHLAQDPVRLALFDREARAAAALNHPHIAAVFDVGTASNLDSPVNYIVQELLEGQTVRAYAQKPLPLRKALDLAIELSEALVAAHEAGIVHRDLKPE